MLGTPDRGWVSFQMEKEEYQLSYLNDIPLEWLERAIFGMESGMTFQVEGHCEPGMLRCTVNPHSCTLACSSDGKKCQEIPMDMLQFCRELHADISRNLEAWSRWQSVRWDLPEKEKEKIYATRKREITAKLQRLGKLLNEKKTAYCE